jgi:hypothetical protein
MIESLRPPVALLVLCVACKSGGNAATPDATAGPVDATADVETSEADDAAQQGPPDATAAMDAGGGVVTCTLPASASTCAELGGGVVPFYYQGWICPDPTCPNGYCAGANLGAPGRCRAPTLSKIRLEVEAGTISVLDGSIF